MLEVNKALAGQLQEGDPAAVPLHVFAFTVWKLSRHHSSYGQRKSVERTIVKPPWYGRKF